MVTWMHEIELGQIRSNPGETADMQSRRMGIRVNIVQYILGEHKIVGVLDI